MTPSSYIVSHYSLSSDHSGFDRALSHGLTKHCFSKLKSSSLPDLALLIGKLFQISDHSSSFVELSPILLHPFRDVGPELHTVCRLMAVHESFWEAQGYPLFCVYYFPCSYKCLICSFNYHALSWHFHALFLAWPSGLSLPHGNSQLSTHHFIHEDRIVPSLLYHFTSAFIWSRSFPCSCNKLFNFENNLKTVFPRMHFD